MFYRVASAIVIASMFFIPASSLTAEEAEHVAPIKAFVSSKIMPWLSKSDVIDAIKQQNTKTQSLSEQEILTLDKTWRAEVDAASKPLIDSVLKNKLSKFLNKKKEEANGMITEVFVMDAKGLNVGQSDITSDYWQGDEAKWKKTFLVGPDTVFVDKVKEDESTQSLQSQASVSIKDETGKVIGAITIGINVDNL